jgi:hypothetical protein
LLQLGELITHVGLLRQGEVSALRACSAWACGCTGATYRAGGRITSSIGVFGSAAPHAYDALLAVMRDIDDRVAPGHEVVIAVEVIDARTGAPPWVRSMDPDETFKRDGDRRRWLVRTAEGRLVRQCTDSWGTGLGRRKQTRAQVGPPGPYTEVLDHQHASVPAGRPTHSRATGLESNGLALARAGS